MHNPDLAFIAGQWYTKFPCFSMLIEGDRDSSSSKYISLLLNTCIRIYDTQFLICTPDITHSTNNAALDWDRIDVENPKFELTCTTFTSQAIRKWLRLRWWVKMCCWLWCELNSEKIKLKWEAIKLKFSLESKGLRQLSLASGAYHWPVDHISYQPLSVHLFSGSFVQITRTNLNRRHGLAEGRGLPYSVSQGVWEDKWPIRGWWPTRSVGQWDKPRACEINCSLLFSN